AGPVENAVDEVVGDRVSERVDDFIEHVRVLDEADGAGGLGGPDVFPALPAGIERAGAELVEALEEERETAARIVDDGVVMVARRVPREQLDAEAGRGFAERVEEDLRGGLVGP